MFKSTFVINFSDGVLHNHNITSKVIDFPHVFPLGKQNGKVMMINGTLKWKIDENKYFTQEKCCLVQVLNK